MIHIKKPEQIEAMREGGKILSDVLWEVLKHVKPGVTEIELDRLAEKLIVERGGQPGFKRVRGYKHTICAATNDVVVHGIPGEYALKEEDVICIDCGVFYKGFHTDMAETVKVNPKRKDVEVDKFLNTGKIALEESLKMVKAGNRIGHISKTIQDIVEGEGYSIVRNLVGHGVGKELHEEPEVPGFLQRPVELTPLLKEGMTIAVEVIYNKGTKDVYLAPDGWTIKSADGSLSAVYERSLVVTKDGYELLTP